MVRLTKFCADLRAWRQQYGVAPREADAILTNIMRANQPSTRQNLPPKGGFEEVAEGCFLELEQVDQWVQARRHPWRLTGTAPRKPGWCPRLPPKNHCEALTSGDKR